MIPISCLKAIRKQIVRICSAPNSAIPIRSLRTNWNQIQKVTGQRNRSSLPGVRTPPLEEDVSMDFTRGALLWLLGVPLPIILLIALFWHH